MEYSGLGDPCGGLMIKNDEGLTDDDFFEHNYNNNNKPSISDHIYSSSSTNAFNLINTIPSSIGASLHHKPPLTSSSPSGHDLMISSGNPVPPASKLNLDTTDHYHLPSINVLANYKKNKLWSRSPLQAQDHVAAERKRRERLSQLFISLSKVLPGLKKWDKISLLGGAIEYIKELQERVRFLEEDSKQTQGNICKTCFDPTDGVCSSKERHRGVVPEIKARILDRNVLIKIHCLRQKGFASTISYQMERLHLSLRDIRIMPFGHHTLDISILAEMENGVRTKVKDIIKAFELAFAS